MLMLAIAFVMMVVAAPGHLQVRPHGAAKSSTAQLTTDVCHQLTSRSDSATVRACRAGPLADSAWAEVHVPSMISDSWSATSSARIVRPVAGHVGGELTSGPAESAGGVSARRTSPPPRRSSSAASRRHAAPRSQVRQAGPGRRSRPGPRPWSVVAADDRILVLTVAVGRTQLGPARAARPVGGVIARDGPFRRPGHRAGRAVCRAGQGRAAGRGRVSPCPQVPGVPAAPSPGAACRVWCTPIGAPVAWAPPRPRYGLPAWASGVRWKRPGRLDQPGPRDGRAPGPDVADAPVVSSSMNNPASLGSIARTAAGSL